ncbi:DUF1934 family protein [uncultured Faecalicoccus sp.]|uniref:DUF1934 family protein n=1 Tax=uncultured Faecalicoccus sp. TaxID=1971760 RepID=UPI0025DE2299|nr:DUF1934 family protein [uncultured Faecalicoccus sp.]
MVQVRLLDLQNDQEIFSGNAHFSYRPHGICWEFGHYVWKAYEDTLIIDSHHEVHVHLICRPGKQSQATIQTEYGEIRLHCQTSLYTINERSIEVRYTLEMEEQIEHFHFRLEIKGAHYAFH